MVGFIFGGNTGLSYSDLQDRRKQEQALAARILGQQPKTVAQGIGALLTGAGIGLSKARTDRGISEGRQGATSQFDSFLSKITGQPSTAAPETSRQTMTPSPTSGGQNFEQVAPRLISDLSKDFGLSPQQAAGVVGQLGHESAGFGTLQEVNPMVKGSRGGYGYAQWTGPRRKQFEAWSSDKGLDPTSYEANYGFLAHELKNTPEGRVLGSVRSAADAQAAGRAFTDEFLRPGIPGYGSRDKWTQRALAFAGNDLEDKVGVPYQPSLAPQDPNAEARRQEAMLQVVGQQPNASGAVNAMASGASAYVDPMVNAQPQQTALPPLETRTVAPIPQVAQAQMPPQMAQAAPQQSGGLDPQMLQLLGNPFLDESQRAVLQTVFQQQAQQQAQAREEQQWRARQDYAQQQRQSDPAYQLGLEQTRSEIERNKQPGYRMLSAQERAAYGIPEFDNRPYQISREGQVSAVGGAGQQQSPGVEASQREKLAAQYGIDPKSAEGQRFILTGTLPASDRGVTAGDREAIRDADDLVNSGEATLGLIDRAIGLSDKAYEGAGAGARAMIASQWGDEGALATREFDNIVTEQALGQLKAIFGGAPTEGERAILLDVQGSSSQPKAVRDAILQRARAAVLRRVNFNRDRSNELRGGTYYKPRDANGQAPAPTAPAAPNVDDLLKKYGG